MAVLGNATRCKHLLLIWTQSTVKGRWGFLPFDFDCFGGTAVVLTLFFKACSLVTTTLHACGLCVYPPVSLSVWSDLNSNRLYLINPTHLNQITCSFNDCSSQWRYQMFFTKDDTLFSDTVTKFITSKKQLCSKNEHPKHQPVVMPLWLEWATCYRSAARHVIKLCRRPNDQAFFCELKMFPRTMGTFHLPVGDSMLSRSFDFGVGLWNIRLVPSTGCSDGGSNTKIGQCWCWKQSVSQVGAMSVPHLI